MVELWQKENGVDAVLPREYALAVSVSVGITVEIA